MTGNAGAGKSTLARLISERLQLHLYGLDKVVWRSGWVKAGREEIEKSIAEIVSNASWVLDGVTQQGLEVAEVIVFLDVPRRVCYWRTLRRNMKYLFKSRPELPPNCPEIKIVPRLWRLIWNFSTNVRPKILRFEDPKNGKRFYHLRTKNDYKAFVQKMGDLS